MPVTEEIPLEIEENSSGFKPTTIVENFDETVSLEEYRILWDYYKITLNERKQLFEWYFKLIAIPVTILAYMFTQASKISTIYFSYVGIALLIIGISGIVLYVTYITESINATHYYNKILKVQKFFRSKSSSLINVYPEPVNDKRGNKYGFDIIKISKGLPIPIINSGVLSLAVYLMFGFPFNIYLYVIYAVFLSTHILIYFALFRLRIL